MKVAVIGSRGRIGERLVRNLRQEDLRVVEASRRTGVDSFTGVRLAEALDGAEVVIDVTNVSPDDGDAAQGFFETSTRNLIETAQAAGVRHHIVLSIVGTDGLLASGYFRGKKVQEELVAGSGIPFTILRSTQFFEFVRDLVQAGTARDIRIAPALTQPIAGEDLADMLANAAFSDPVNGVVEVAGPEQLRLDEVAAEIATAFEDTRRIVADIGAPYFGATLNERSLLPGPCARIAALRFDDWLRDSLQPSRPSTLVN